MPQKKEIFRILNERFGYKEFRHGQQEVIESLIARRDTVAIMPTGSGKSICYQIPAIYFGGVCLVVSPLIALMKDQVRSLQANGIRAGSLHSGMSADEKFDLMTAAKFSESFILFVSPERLMQEAFLDYLFTLKICFVVVDEAHCIVEWGSDFRPDYQRLQLFKQQWKVPVLALTASATPEMRKEIAKHLSLESPEFICSGFFRDALFCRVQLCSDFEMKMAVTTYSLEKISSGRILIYCATRLQCESVAKRLSTRFEDVTFYHAGLSFELRSEVQEAMNQRRIKILCCTCAFGMGIDYPDVRLVIHFEIPTSVEELYQEMGRAGRDGKSALVLTLYSERDLHAKYLQLSSHTQKVRETKRRMKALEGLEKYLRTKACRHRMISEYFGDLESFRHLKSCHTCDFCCGNEESHEVPKIFDVRLRNRLQKLLSIEKLT